MRKLAVYALAIKMDSIIEDNAPYKIYGTVLKK